MAIDREFTRLYRCEPIPTEDRRPEWIRQAQQESGHAEAQGRWFVADPSMLDWYREDSLSPTRIVHVDVPTSDLEQYRVSNSAEQIGKRTVRSYSRDPENEFFLPREIASKALPDITQAIGLDRSAWPDDYREREIEI